MMIWRAIGSYEEPSEYFLLCGTIYLVRSVLGRTECYVFGNKQKEIVLFNRITRFPLLVSCNKSLKGIM